MTDPCLPVPSHHSAATLRAWGRWRSAHPFWIPPAPDCARVPGAALPAAPGAAAAGAGRAAAGVARAGGLGFAPLLTAAGTAALVVGIGAAVLGSGGEAAPGRPGGGSAPAGPVVEAPAAAAVPMPPLLSPGAPLVVGGPYGPDLLLPPVNPVQGPGEPVPVPEPRSALLLGAWAGVLAALKQRRAAPGKMEG